MSNIQYQVTNCAIVILAAGQSSRLGRPKQLLFYNGESLIQQTVHEALKTNLPVLMVVGAYNEKIINELKGLNIEVVVNEKWSEGMSTSLKCGLAFARTLKPDLDGIIFAVSDQPFISVALLNELLTTQLKTGCPIIASNYGDQLGTPVLFHKKFFSELMKLKADAGAKKLIKAHKNEVTSVYFSKGEIDIDTNDDYEALLKNS